MLKLFPPRKFENMINNIKETKDAPLIGLSMDWRASPENVSVTSLLQYPITK
jgi:hypothetical protein